MLCMCVCVRMCSCVLLYEHIYIIEVKQWCVKGNDIATNCIASIIYNLALSFILSNFHLLSASPSHSLSLSERSEQSKHASIENQTL